MKQRGLRVRRARLLQLRAQLAPEELGTGHATGWRGAAGLGARASASPAPAFPP